ncbi:CPCC family cysteine-rich protein [Bacillus sp. CBEL-1]|uniref:CPCC family cysteine-rich protein n=1 Tax=Bacillus sp. CBEL-1 TaxID=2502980 RepID=UPI001051F093|nr:CPCC family cysteine-rich protein [Bacillus sp. CBEL-1]TDB49551.1 hypothetical protein EPL02_10575 [Bacillus sp. CBEL-1]
MQRTQCPCCKCLTLEERGNDDICIVCDWEDDGQDDPYADKVYGGPNGEYSLSQARENFKAHGTMYNKLQYKPSAKEEEIKSLLINTYKKLDFDKYIKKEEAWKEILYYEEALRNERYSSDI